MLSYLFGSGSVIPITVKLVPSESAKKLPGFYSGEALSISVNSGDTVGEMLAKFNQFRGPDAQILQIYDVASKHLIPHSHKIFVASSFLII